MSIKSNRNSGNPVQPGTVPSAAEVSAGDHVATPGDNLDGIKGASPSNTAPNNSKDETRKEDQPYFQALRWGVDSLYVSYKGKLTLETEIILKRLKELAQSQRPSDAAVAQLQIGDHIFEVKDRGTGLFAFMNADQLSDEVKQAKGLNAAADAYRKASDGE